MTSLRFVCNHWVLDGNFCSRKQEIFILEFCHHFAELDRRPQSFRPSNIKQRHWRLSTGMEVTRMQWMQLHCTSYGCMERLPITMRPAMQFTGYSVLAFCSRGEMHVVRLSASSPTDVRRPTVGTDGHTRCRIVSDM